MKKVFISVPTKLLLLVVGALLILSTGFSIMSLTRLNQEFEYYQAENKQQGEIQFNIQSANLRDQIRTWIESFSDVVRIKEQTDFTMLAKELEQQFDALQLNQNVENVWLVDQKENLLFSSINIPDYAANTVKATFQAQEPQYQLFCQFLCEQLITVPLLNKRGDMVVVAMTVSLVDMIYAINQSVKSDIAIVSYANKSKRTFNRAQFVSASNTQLVKSLFVDQANQTYVEEVLAKGLQLDIQSGNYLVNLLPLAINSERNFYMAIIDDVTAFNVQFSEYRRQFLLSSLLIFVTLAILVYFVSSPFTRRLLLLSNVLPLLARKEFDKFRQVEMKKTGLVTDELDILTDASLELSYELEQLNLEVEQKTKELENIAMYDLLTGLPNRNMLNYQLRKAIVNLSKYNQNVTVLFLDLDDFKKVNDSHGHSEGDKLLIEAANRVRLSIRNVDIACRFGGDEFVVILGQVDGLKQAQEIADNILAQFKEPIKLGSSIFYVSTSIGIAYSEAELVKAEELISHADIAMYEAKDGGGAQYHVYHNDMYQRVAQRVMLEGEVRQALAKNQFSLSLQPQICAKNNKLSGFEALLRWQHPERGMVSPDDFIPILENSEHMIDLGYWVIRRCFELLIEMRKKGLTDIRIAINLSAGQFIDNNLPHYLQSLLTEFEVSAESFELELTEQTLVKDIDRAIEMMENLRELGFSFAIDDFGTGYSSLAYIKKMPVDVIKIDKSFVFGMLENYADYQIIMSTIAMVKNLGLQVIAEGVESSAQLRSLTENGCDTIQGYYFSKPVPEVELLEFIDTKLTGGYWKTKAQ
ncbi:putative bifunctional diguanylate cyclase/phosphodiesterase [Thalassotalea sp. PLHSN55]|uniref:putative bifunctional diguanylate cyclase/phosphodiesterase n=1 Tax=Thalassotalea sp. PLHSN55 TaxID=3435888 RepID=UPI003F875D6F